MRIAVGCPIRNRAWIFPAWEEHVRTAFEIAGLTPYWVFAIGVGPTGEDDGTMRLATNLAKTDSMMWTEIAEPEVSLQRENWTRERLEHMTAYRNRLLEVVRAVEPDYFLSVDSDILLHPAAIAVLLDTISKKRMIHGIEKKFSAVGGKTFLGMSKHIASYAHLNPMGGLQRQDADGVFPVQIIMALKLMDPDAYNVDYSYHQLGEDVGWSLNCANAGLALGWDGRITSKHCMYREQLDKVDSRVGW